MVLFFTLLLLIGKTMFEMGGLKAKSIQHLATKNICQLGTVIVVFYCCGYGISINADGGFYGTGSYFFYDSNFLYRFIACWFAVSIASTGIAERTFLGTHNSLAVIVAGIIYPVVSSWSRGSGWLSDFGFIDYAGAGPVHLVGGTIALIGTLYLKP